MQTVTKLVATSNFANFTELANLVSAFEDCSLPRAHWTHQAHLAVAFWYLLTEPSPLALEKMRLGIQRYNWANDVRSTPTSGYHETLTQFWVRMIHHYLSDIRLDAHLVAVLNQLIELHDKELPLTYYSRMRLFSAAARQHWVAPDLRPLPGKQGTDAVARSFDALCCATQADSVAQNN